MRRVMRKMRRVMRRWEGRCMTEERLLTGEHCSSSTGSHCSWVSTLHSCLVTISFLRVFFVIAWRQSWAKPRLTLSCKPPSSHLCTPRSQLDCTFAFAHSRTCNQIIFAMHPSLLLHTCLSGTLSGTDGLISGSYSSTSGTYLSTRVVWYSVWHFCSTMVLQAAGLPSEHSSTSTSRQTFTIQWLRISI